jgi:hypothetical protein
MPIPLRRPNPLPGTSFSLTLPARLRQARARMRAQFCGIDQPGFPANDDFMKRSGGVGRFETGGALAEPGHNSIQPSRPGVDFASLLEPTSLMADRHETRR